MASNKSLHSIVRDTAERKPKLVPCKATSVEVRKADDSSGFIVKTHQDEGDTRYMPPHESIHKSLASVHKHMKTAFGAGPKDDDGDET